MECIYCGGKTQVTNSRPQKRLLQVWRRRHCLACDALFTTLEAIDTSTSLVVRHPDGSLEPFSRDTLFISILRALGHRRRPVDDAGALTATISARLLHDTRDALINAEEVIKAATAALSHFDDAAAVQYRAYHRLKTS